MIPLHADALPGLLDGWQGPAHLLDHGPVTVLNMSSKGLVNIVYDGEVVPTTTHALSLDLARAECRDRVVRVLASAFDLTIGSTAPLWGPNTWGGRVDWMIRSPGHDTRFFAPTLPQHADPAFWTRVPALAGLQPATDRLPDGSLVVAATALALVATHVGRT